MGENIFDDIDGEYTLTKDDFLPEKYHRVFGK